MGNDNQEEKEEKEDKPKKAFSIKTIVWTDGGVDCLVQEYRKLGTGRGAPTLCGPLTPSQFIKALKDMGLNAQGVLQAISMDVGITKDLQSMKAIDVIQKIEEDTSEDAPTPQAKKSSKKAETSSDENADDIPESLNFDEDEK